MAHQDDEAAFSTRITCEISMDNSITCVYLTDGAGKGASPHVRDREFLQVLRSPGILDNCVHFIRSQYGIPDGNLADYLGIAYDNFEFVKCHSFWT